MTCGPQWTGGPRLTVGRGTCTCSACFCSAQSPGDSERSGREREYVPTLAAVLHTRRRCAGPRAREGVGRMATLLAHIRVRPGAEKRFEQIARELHDATHACEHDVRRYEYWRGAEPRSEER